MQLWEGVRLAMVQLRTEKLKSFFSLIGVIIGVLFLIVVVSVVEGMDRYIRESVASELFGVNTVTLRRTPEVQINPTEEERRAWARRPSITFDDADRIRERLRIPARVLVEIYAGRPLVGDNGRTATGVSLSGASADVFAVRNLDVERGRPEHGLALAGRIDPADHPLRVVHLAERRDPVHDAAELLAARLPLGRDRRVLGRVPAHPVPDGVEPDRERARRAVLRDRKYHGRGRGRHAAMDGLGHETAWSLF